jgi:hypothetical protein
LLLGTHVVAVRTQEWRKFAASVSLPNAWHLLAMYSCGYNAAVFS